MDCDKKAGIITRVDPKTIYRVLIDLKYRNQIKQYKITLSRGDNIREILIFSHRSLASTDKEFLDKCRHAIALKTDQISRKEMRTQSHDTQEEEKKSNHDRSMPRFQKLRAIHLYLYILAFGLSKWNIIF